MTKQTQSLVSSSGKNAKPEIFRINNRVVERQSNGSWTYRVNLNTRLLSLEQASTSVISEMIKNLTNCPIKPKGSLLELLKFLEETLNIRQTSKVTTVPHCGTNLIRREGLRLPNKIYQTKIIGTYIYYINQYAFELIDGKNWIVTDDTHQRQPIDVLSLSILVFLNNCLCKCVNDSRNYNPSLHKEIETKIADLRKLECTIGDYKFKNTSPDVWVMTNAKNGKSSLVSEANKDFLRRLCKILDDTPENHPEYNSNLHNFIKLTCSASETKTDVVQK